MSSDNGIPILSVKEIISAAHVTKLPGLPDFIPGVINLRGDVIPLYTMRSRFGISSEFDDSESVVIAIQLNEIKTVGMIVDSVYDIISLKKEDMRARPEFSGSVDVRFVDKIGQLMCAFYPKPAPFPAPSTETS